MINFSELLWRPQKGSRSSTTSGGDEAQLLEQSSALGRVPVEVVQITPENRIALLTDSYGPGADRFRYLRMRLRELKSAAKLKSLVITSPLPEEGKSTVALNLATALAEGGKSSVLLIEADLYHPTIVTRLGLKPASGLAECLEESSDPIQALRRIEPPNFYLLSAGKPRGNPADLLQSEALLRVMDRLANQFDWIVVDTPPVTPLTDALALSRHVDATLLVVRADRTPREAVDEALARLGIKHVLGIIFNAADGLNKIYSDYDRYYAKK